MRKQFFPLGPGDSRPRRLPLPGDPALSETDLQRLRLKLAGKHGGEEEYRGDRGQGRARVLGKFAANELPLFFPGVVLVALTNVW